MVEPALSTSPGNAVVVQVDAALSGNFVCRVSAQGVPELKLAIERASGVPRSAQQLLSRGEPLGDDCCQLARIVAGSSGCVAVTLLLRRTVAGATWRALQQLSSTNFESTIAGIREELADLPVECAQELREAAAAIVERALAEAWLSEGCAEIALSLHVRCQQVPPHRGVDLPAKFKAFLSERLQVELERLRNSSGDFAASEVCVADPKADLLPATRCLASLGRRKLVPMVTVIRVALRLVQGIGELPDAKHVECACELLGAAGPQMDRSHVGTNPVTQVVDRLAGLKSKVDPVSGEHAYPEKLVDRIQNLIALRASGWRPPQVAHDAFLA